MARPDDPTLNGLPQQAQVLSILRWLLLGSIPLLLWLPIGSVWAAVPGTIEMQATDTLEDETAVDFSEDHLSRYVAYVRETPEGGDVYLQRVAPELLLGDPVLVSDPRFDDRFVDADGDHIVYASYAAPGSTLGEIKVSEISTGTTRIVSDLTTVDEPKLRGRFVTWVQGDPGRTRLLLGDLWVPSWGTVPSLVLAGPDPAVSEPAVGDRFVVWQEDRDGQVDVRAYDLESETWLDVAVDPALDETSPTTWGPWIAWVEGSGTGTRIRAWNADTGEARGIVDDGAQNLDPDADGAVLTYESDLTGDFDVYLYRFDLDQSVQVTDDPHDQRASSVYGDTVAYLDTRNGNRDVYYLTFGFGVSMGVPEGVGFGCATTIAPAFADLTVENNGLWDLVVSDLSMASEDGPFSVRSPTDLPVGVPPGGELEIGLELLSNETGTISDTLEITANTRSSPQTVAVEAEAVVGSLELDRTEYVSGDPAAFVLTAPATDPDAPDVTTVQAWSDTDREGISVEVTETGARTCRFGGSFQLAAGPSDDPGDVLQVSPGDVVIVSHLAAEGSPSSDTASVVSPNRAPQAAPDAYEVDEDTVLEVAAPGVLGNDHDPDGDSLSAVVVTDASHGSLALDGDGSFTYTPDADFHGTDGFSYAASDGAGDSAPATVTITVQPVNDAPTVDAGPDTSGPEGTPVTLTGSASDVDGDQLTIGWVSTDQAGAAHCRIADDSAPTTTVTCADDGTFTFLLVADDGVAPSVHDSVEVTVTNAAPTVAIERVESEGGADTLLVGVPVQLDASWSDACCLDTHLGSVDWEDATPPTSVQTGWLTDDPPGGRVEAAHVYETAGTFTVTVSVTDDDGGRGVASVEITVLEPVEATESVADELDETLDDPSVEPDAAEAVGDAVDALQGQNDGQAANGALDHLDSGDLNAALQKIKMAIEDLEAAEAADPDLDLTEAKRLLALTAKSIAVDVVDQAEAAADTPRERRKLDQAKTLLAEGDALLANGDFAGAVSSYQDALRKTQAAPP